MNFFTPVFKLSRFYFHLNNFTYVMGAISWQQLMLENLGNHERLFTLPVYPSDDYLNGIKDVNIKLFS